MAQASAPTSSARLLAFAGGASWLWAFWLLSAKGYDPLAYYVTEPLPPLWGFIGGNLTPLVVGAVGAAALTAGCLYLAKANAAVARQCSLWLLTSMLVALLDIAALLEIKTPGAYLAPIGFALLTGLVVRRLVQSAPELANFHEQLTPRRVGAVLWMLAVMCGGWWFWQGWQAYDHFLLGFSDFGHFAVRVVHTWEGHGFLRQGPDLPIFWDHFNPGLALLAPLWGLWPDPKLFILLQALCLAAPGPLVFAIARRLGCSPLAAGLWGGAYLALPAVVQLNLSYGYGWHPESIALPLLFASAYALLCRQRILAAALAIVAASFAEVVVVAIGCVAFATLLDAVATGRLAPGDYDVHPWTAALPIWGWLGVWLFFTAAFVLIHQATEASRFQEGRFATLGESGAEILLSPLLRPHVFWSYILRPRCLYFVLAVFAPLGLANIFRARWIALALVPPLLVLLAWKESSGTSLAFQYTTTLIPLGMLASLIGARRSAPLANERRSLSLAASACVAALTMSCFIGALPWSSPTLHVLAARSYPPSNQPGDPRPSRAAERAPGSPGHEALAGLIAKIGDQDASVLATGRVGAHLLGVKYVETVDNVTVRWNALSNLAGEGKSAVELFDWVLLDTLEQGHQTPEKIARIRTAAEAAGYRVIYDEQDLVLLQRPGS